MRRPPRSTRTDTLFPSTTLFRSELLAGRIADRGAAADAPPALSQRGKILCFDRIWLYRRASPFGACRRARSVTVARSGIFAHGRTSRPRLPDPRSGRGLAGTGGPARSEENKCVLKSLMRISLVVFWLKQKSSSKYIYFL